MLLSDEVHCTHLTSECPLSSANIEKLYTRGIQSSMLLSCMDFVCALFCKANYICLGRTCKLASKHLPWGQWQSCIQRHLRVRLRLTVATSKQNISTATLE